PFRQQRDGMGDSLAEDAQLDLVGRRPVDAELFAGGRRARADQDEVLESRDRFDGQPPQWIQNSGQTLRRRWLARHLQDIVGYLRGVEAFVDRVLDVLNEFGIGCRDLLFDDAEVAPPLFRFLVEAILL